MGTQEIKNTPPSLAFSLGFLACCIAKMAEEAFKSSPMLKHFILSDVVPTGKKLGSGSYGSVEEVCLKAV